MTRTPAVIPTRPATRVMSVSMFTDATTAPPAATMAALAVG
jgi:hypothetical protein